LEGLRDGLCDVKVIKGLRDVKAGSPT
jgi:hypothetical protein